MTAVPIILYLCTFAAMGLFIARPRPAVLPLRATAPAHRQHQR